ncbi:hypothetical protein [Bradyrhizobium sp. BR 10289]|uniref:hypothetical protein n=1 Tax=Bradyrhizobium sp. BR 10289 TaxID=2749993 RepID=UPI001C652C39|nr:hypothetical protein [Bradyrhizobium sp. BR 10289]MBW7969379.1 hypothetical protein [Bradyrhizobium sp. BR 10289]
MAGALILLGSTAHATDEIQVYSAGGYAFPVPGQKPDGNTGMSSGPVNPFIHAATRTLQP